ncbi:MAG: glycosyltransferase family 9 protein [Acetobacteraceae bacterium]
MAAVPADLILTFVGRDLTGDGVMKLPFLRALRESYPRARILWVAAGKSVFATTLRPLTRSLVNEVIEDTGIGASWRDIIRPALVLPCADLLIDTQRHVRTSLALRRLRPRRFISAAAGWRLSSLRPAERDKPPAMLGQMFRLLEACGAQPDLARLPPLVLPALSEAEAMQRLPPGPPLVGLAPGAGGRHKCWPLDNYLTLGQALAGRGFRPVVLLGPDEQEWRLRVEDALPQALLPIGADDSPLMTIALARRLSVAVANDSGTGHLLAAAGATLISLFGPTDPNKFAPASPNLVVIRAQDFGASAMAAIPVQAVRARLFEALAPGPGNGS